MNRRRAYLWGHGAEFLALVMLFVKGYHILCRRFKCPAGEVDIIARKGNMMVFIEVKARRTFADAAHALSTAQKKRIIRAATWYMSRQKKAGQETLYRFDMVLVSPWRWPSHIKDAWQT